MAEKPARLRLAWESQRPTLTNSGRKPVNSDCGIALASFAECGVVARRWYQAGISKAPQLAAEIGLDRIPELLGEIGRLRGHAMGGGFT